MVQICQGRGTEFQKTEDKKLKVVNRTRRIFVSRWTVGKMWTLQSLHERKTGGFSKERRKGKGALSAGVPASVQAHHCTRQETEIELN